MEPSAQAPDVSRKSHSDWMVGFLNEYPGAGYAFGALLLIGAIAFALSVVPWMLGTSPIAIFG